MEFTKLHYLLFFLVVFSGYWSLQKKGLQNFFLLCASYLFYGWVHPWFCLLLVASTLLDFSVGLSMELRPQHKKKALFASLIGNLGLLATFKYFNFFIDNVHALGIIQNKTTLSLVLPVGISFYTFQTLSYTIDIYKGEMKPTCWSPRFCSCFIWPIAGSGCSTRFSKGGGSSRSGSGRPLASFLSSPIATQFNSFTFSFSHVETPSSRSGLCLLDLPHRFPRENPRWGYRPSATLD